MIQLLKFFVAIINEMIYNSDISKHYRKLFSNSQELTLRF